MRVLHIQSAASHCVASFRGRSGAGTVGTMLKTLSLHMPDDGVPRNEYRFFKTDPDYSRG